MCEIAVIDQPNAGGRASGKVINALLINPCVRVCVCTLGFRKGAKLWTGVYKYTHPNWNLWHSCTFLLTGCTWHANMQTHRAILEQKTLSSFIYLKGCEWFQAGVSKLWVFCVSVCVPVLKLCMLMHMQMFMFLTWTTWMTSF